MEVTDLNRLREIIKTTQADDTPSPARTDRRVAVGSEGEIHVGGASAAPNLG